MARNRTKQKIKLNNLESLQGLMQETYIDACTQINDAQRTVNELLASSIPEDVDDVTKIAREKSNALKIKDSAIKIKLEMSKLMNDIIKHNGSLDDLSEAKPLSAGGEGGGSFQDSLRHIRDMIKNKDSDGVN